MAGTAGHDEVVREDAHSWKCKFPLAERPEPRYTDKIALERRPSLDIGRLAVMFAQSLGSLIEKMRNIITKLLILVVPWRTAGGG
jgi:hypothetical protein